MQNYELLKGLEREIEKCVLCGGCSAGCPTYDLSRHEKDSARGRVMLAKALLAGEIEPDANLMEKFDHCLSCMNCVDTCPAGAEPVKVITAARGEIYKAMPKNSLSELIFRRLLPDRKALSSFVSLVRVGQWFLKYLPPSRYLPFVRGGKKRKIPQIAPKTLRDIYPEILPPKGKYSQGEPFMRVAYFTGCMADRAFHDTARAVMEVLISAGVEIVLPKGEVCCGAPAYFAGDRDSAAAAAEVNLHAFNPYTVDYIVTSCATCGSVLKDIYPELLSHRLLAQKLSEKVIDFQQLVSEKLWDRLKFKEANGNPLKVTYHDPCHLSRGLRVKDAPRDILSKLPGVEFVEMEKPCRCCGGAGSFCLKYYDDALEIGRQKAESVMGSGADVVATACPSCRMQIGDLLNRYNGGGVVHTAAIIARSLVR
ncbi:MAG: (Fe-S)-binding protein [Nitrospinota bacterium]